MKRVKLRLDDLNVESFAVLPENDRVAGTVHAAQLDVGNQDPVPVSPVSCAPPTCGNPTCDFTCPNTCKWTCDDPTCVPNTGCHTGPCNCDAADEEVAG